MPHDGPGQLDETLDGHRQTPSGKPFLAGENGRTAPGIQSPDPLDGLEQAGRLHSVNGPPPSKTATFIFPVGGLIAG